MSGIRGLRRAIERRAIWAVVFQITLLAKMSRTVGVSAV